MVETMSTATRASLSSSSSESLSRSMNLQAPSSVRHFEGNFMNLRGQLLFYFALYPPSKRKLRGVVLYLHGVGDHCRRFISLYEGLCSEGFGVITYDLVNHGASTCDSHKTRGHVRNFRQLVEDTNTYVTFAKNVIFPQSGHLAPPMLIAGSSFGSLVGLHVVLSDQHKFHAAFWASPTVGMEMKAVWKVQAAVIQPLALFLPRVRLIPSVDYELLWRDPGILADFKADSLAIKNDITARTMQQTLKAMHRIMKDKSIQQCVTRGFYDKIANTDKTLKVFDGVFHCVFEDPESEEILDHLFEWLRDRFPDLHTSQNSL